jgi:hypothetical protein
MARRRVGRPKTRKVKRRTVRKAKPKRASTPCVVRSSPRLTPTQLKMLASLLSRGTSVY